MSLRSKITRRSSYIYVCMFQYMTLCVCIALISSAVYIYMCVCFSMWPCACVLLSSAVRCTYICVYVSVRDPVCVYRPHQQCGVRPQLQYYQAAAALRPRLALHLPRRADVVAAVWQPRYSRPHKCRVSIYHRICSLCSLNGIDDKCHCKSVGSVAGIRPRAVFIKHF